MNAVLKQTPQIIAVFLEMSKLPGDIEHGAECGRNNVEDASFLERRERGGKKGGRGRKKKRMEEKGRDANGDRSITIDANFASNLDASDSGVDNTQKGGNVEKNSNIKYNILPKDRNSLMWLHEELPWVRPEVEPLSRPCHRTVYQAKLLVRGVVSFSVCFYFE